MTQSEGSSPAADSVHRARGGARPSFARRALIWAFRIGGTAAGFAYIASIVDMDELGTAFGRVGIGAFAAACAMMSLGLVVASLRWRIMLSAYGAEAPPPFLTLVRAYWIGLFYNSFLPGGLGGDIVRGVVTRKAFGERGATASLTVVFVERALGLTGLLLLVSGTALVRPLPGTEGLLPLCMGGLAASIAAIALLAIGYRLPKERLGRLGKIVGSLPKIERPLSFALALVLSLGTQVISALVGWILLDAVHPAGVRVFDAFVIVPLAMATAFLPFTVGGAGAREATLVTLCAAALGMNEANALAASLLIFGAQLAVALPGGPLQLLSPREPSPAR
ncbi:MAG: lysylphosphatidylglycerol synthase transmembrane domain-containing protein [Sandaracinaceae bacterium]